jgi:DNA-binding NtrC family response regulator
MQQHLSIQRRSCEVLGSVKTQDNVADPTGQTRPQSFSGVVVVPRIQLAVVREGGKAVERRVELEGERIRIGSHPSNDLVLDDRMVSRFHCTLTLGRSAWQLSDSGSLNGSFLSGVRFRDADLPTTECELGLGSSLVRVLPLRAASVVRVSEAQQFGEIHGTSVAMRQVFSLLEKVAGSDATVLIQGESGTGKELLAQEIVRRGPRAKKPFITLDCSAISPNLIESELFGHARGAFTGADRVRIGAFEAAHGGTLFLDEIGEMPIDMQPKLLRALEAREIRRAGENEVRKVDVRVIAASNRNLEREVNRARFREDLYFRLSVVTVHLPPLRERPEDIPLLVRTFLERLGATESEPLFTPEVFRDLAEHEWPGNVRELRNYVERALVLEDARVASSGAVSAPAEPTELFASTAGIHEPFKVAKERLVTDFERAYLEQLMGWAGGNVSRAARKAKIDRMYLHRLLQRYEITRESISDE